MPEPTKTYTMRTEPTTDLALEREELEILVLALSDYGFKRKNTLHPSAIQRMKKLEAKVESGLIRLRTGR